MTDNKPPKKRGLRPKTIYEITIPNDHIVFQVSKGTREIEKSLKEGGLEYYSADVAKPWTYRMDKEWEGDPDLEDDFSDWEPEDEGDTCDKEPDADDEYSEQPANPINQTEWTLPRSCYREGELIDADSETL